MAITFYKLDAAVAHDRDIANPVLRLYVLMLSIANINTRQVTIYVRDIARLYRRSKRTVQRHLHSLCEMGLIMRIDRKRKGDPRWNEKTTFIVCGNDAPRYWDALPNDYKGDFGGSCQKVSWGGDTQRHPEKILRENKDKDTLRREQTPLEQYTFSESPQTEMAIQAEKTVNQSETAGKGQNPTPCRESAQNHADQDTPLIRLTDVPEVMRPTARYLLLVTNRKNLNPSELEPLTVLAKNHTPTRIQKEIDVRVEQFKSSGRKLSFLTFNYLAKCLEEQVSRKKKTTVSDKKPKVSTPSVGTPVIAIKEKKLLSSEAEKVISEYAPAVKKPDNNFATFLERISPAKDLEEYLQLHYPEAEEEELRTDWLSRRDWDDLCEAYRMDMTCAACTDPERCPFNRAKSRPIPMLKEHKLTVGRTLRTACKHGTADPAFAENVRKSGLTENQVKQTFTAFAHTTPELTVAKAKAILSAKNGTSLVLAGKPGTGKTHLAIAIALDAMRSGKRAMFRTVPDLICELRNAEWNHDDFFGLRQRFRDTDVLVLDDWGKEKTTEKGKEYLYQIINSRYTNGRPTIMTTNAVNPGELGDVEALVSRLLEKGDWVVMRGIENHRLKEEQTVITSAESAEPIEVAEPVDPVTEPKMMPEQAAESETTAEPEMSTDPNMDLEPVEELAESVQEHLPEEAVEELIDEELRYETQPETLTEDPVTEPKMIVEQAAESETTAEPDMITDPNMDLEPVEELTEPVQEHLPEELIEEELPETPIEDPVADEPEEPAEPEPVKKGILEYFPGFDQMSESDRIECLTWFREEQDALDAVLAQVDMSRQGIYRYFPTLDSMNDVARQTVTSWYLNGTKWLTLMEGKKPAEALAQKGITDYFPKFYEMPESERIECVRWLLREQETLDAVLAQADMSRQGIYRYYPTLDDMTPDDRQKAETWYLDNNKWLKLTAVPDQETTDHTDTVTPTQADQMFADDDLWEEDEDEYRLYGNTGIPRGGLDKFTGE